MITDLTIEDYFPYCTQQGGDVSMINKQRIKQLVLRNIPLSVTQIEKSIQDHLLFLQNGGAGGKWKIIQVKGIVVALYFGEEVTHGKQANFERQQFPKNIDLQNVVLPFSNFCASIIDGADFQGANLSYSVFTDIEASKANFSNAELAYIDFTRSNLEGVNFQNANLIGADFENCNLTGANFKRANLSQARFPGAILKNIRI